MNTVFWTEKWMYANLVRQIHICYAGISGNYLEAFFVFSNWVTPEPPGPQKSHFLGSLRQI